MLLLYTLNAWLLLRCTVILYPLTLERYSGQYPNCIPSQPIPPQRGYLPLPQPQRGYLPLPQPQSVNLLQPQQIGHLPPLPQRGYLPLPQPQIELLPQPQSENLPLLQPQSENLLPPQRGYLPLSQPQTEHLPLQQPQTQSVNLPQTQSLHQSGHLPPTPSSQCPSGSFDEYPYCQLTPPAPSPQCPSGSFGEYPFCEVTPPCPSGSFGQYPYCQRPPLIKTSQLSRPPPISTCIIGWDEFKTKFNKKYPDTDEEQNRQALFQENQKLIATRNALYEKGEETYSLCVNQFSDWTEKEYLNINGIAHTELPHVSAESDDPFGNAREDIDDEKDWRDDGAVTEIKDQLNCASCWAFSATGALESHFFIKKRFLKSLSEQQLMDCTIHLGNKGCNKGFYTKAFSYTQSEGIRGESEYPYEAKDNTCRAASTDLKNIHHRNVTAKNERELKEVVRNIGPVSIAIDATGYFQSLGAHGVYYNPKCTQKPTHAVLVIGYGYDKRLDMAYWLVKNSFGTTWGNDGYFKIARYRNNHCGLANFPAYPIV